jgi:hypothetical protein
VKKQPKSRAKKQRSRQRSSKPKYRIRNWAQYNRSLTQRGSITFWVEQEALRQWTAPAQTGKRGRPALYHNLAILTALTLAAIFCLPLRQTEGFLVSLFRIMGVTLPVPHSSTICRRRKTLKVPLRARKRSKDEPMHVVVDSTGLKVYGEGEWKVRQHGYSKRRTWRKLHLAIDEATGEILADELTGNDVHDSEMLLPLVERIEESIGQLSGDGAYDSHAIHNELHERGIRTSIPPRRGSRTKKHGNIKGEKVVRDEIVRRIREVGRKRWKVECGYHRRSLAETAMFRHKTIFGDRLSARQLETQRVEASIRSRALNRMTALGMPDSYLVT